MEFKTIQHRDSKDIIMFFIDKKRVTRNNFLYIEHIQWLKGGKYSNSLTTLTRTGNFRHTASL